MTNFFRKAAQKVRVTRSIRPSAGSPIESLRFESIPKETLRREIPFESTSDPKEDEYRRLLKLPTAGALLKSEIEQAFKMAAKRSHPDLGGSNEEFQQLLAAKDALIKCSGLV